MSPLDRTICSVGSKELEKTLISKSLPSLRVIFSSRVLFIKVSCFLLYAIKSTILPILILCLLLKLTKSGILAIVPSSFMISHIVPAGSKPANLARSTDASV